MSLYWKKALDNCEARRDRLEALNAELLRAAKDLIGMASSIEHAVEGMPHTASAVAYVLEQFRAALAKARGEKI